MFWDRFVEGFMNVFLSIGRFSTFSSEYNPRRLNHQYWRIKTYHYTSDKNNEDTDLDIPEGYWYSEVRYVPKKKKKK